LEISDEKHAAEDSERLDADQPMLRDAADDRTERPGEKKEVAGGNYSRRAAIAWNLFGMADLVNAFVLGALTGGGGGGIVFPIVLIPIYAVPRAFLVHSYSLIGLLRQTSPHPVPAESPHYRIGTASNVIDVRQREIIDPENIDTRRATSTAREAFLHRDRWPQFRARSSSPAGRKIWLS
jgi:hypothetical protein